MAGSALMSIGQRALTANYAALQTTGNNIANAATVGYSRQTAELETAGSQGSGAGFFGKGVNVATVTRAHSEYLTREVATTRAVAAADSTRYAQLQQLEKVFGLGEDGLAYAAGQFFGAFVDVASKPQDSSARQVALARADDLAVRFRSAAQQLDNQQAGVSQDLKLAVTSVNSLTRQIADLNQRIALAQGSGHTPNDLLDQRDTAISDLSQYLQVSTIAAADGSVGVFAGGGQRLVLGTETTKLVALQDPYDPSRVQIGVDDIGGVRTLPPSLISAGSIAGLLRFQNTDLVDARNLLGQMASAISDGINRQQALGLDLRTPPGAGAPLLAVGAARVLPSTANASVAGVPVASYLDASGVRVPSVALNVVQADALVASDYELVADPAGAAGVFQLTRLSDGTRSSVTNGTLVDGFRIDIGAPAPAAGDRFLLQPVSAAARDMRRVLDDPKGLAAASPVTAQISVTNAGTASVASLRAASPALDTNLRADITFTDANGGYSYSLVDTTGASPTVTGTGSWTPGQPIALNGWELQLNGVPGNGDTLSVGKTPFPASDNANANAMLALRDAALVNGETVTEAYAAALANMGVRVQGAELSSQMSTSIAAEAQDAQAAKTGVNLDEEAARLIQFQQSYQAAAKMLQVAQSVFDTLLDLGAR
jgi:flagellar hook-associated protein 1 FlgK